MHTCIEATVRYAAELGYDVTVVRDATADYSDEMMHAALDINLPNYATAVVTTKEVVASNIFQRAGEFPNSTDVEYPVAPAAIDFYRNGPSFMQRYLPLC
jgi:hypothetical protein